jgi:hypothetical protein
VQSDDYDFRYRSRILVQLLRLLRDSWTSSKLSIWRSSSRAFVLKKSQLLNRLLTPVLELKGEECLEVFIPYWHETWLSVTYPVYVWIRSVIQIKYVADEMFIYILIETSPEWHSYYITLILESVDSE